MHLCIGKNIAKKLNKTEVKEFMLGNLAPDLSKITNQSKYISHFLKKIELNGVEAEVPDIERFLKEYGDRLDESFVQGYFCHLISDDLWYREYIPMHVMGITEDKNQILLRDIDDYIPYSEFKRMVYEDYYKSNKKLFKMYKLSLKKFNDFDIENPNMKEFEYEKIYKLIEQISFYLDYDESTSNVEEEVEGISDVELDDDKESEFNLLSENEILTYIEEAIQGVTDMFEKENIIK